MNLVNYRLENSYSVAVIPNDSANNKVWQFPDIPTLRDRKTVGLQVKLSSVDIATNKSNLGSLVARGNYPCFLTLIDTTGRQFIQSVPVVETNPVNYAVASATYAMGYLRNINGIFAIAPRTVAWSKCFVYFPTATALSNYCLVFNIYYL